VRESGDRSGRQSSRRTDAGDRWGDAVQRLLAAGHRYPEILNYTLPQVDAFLRAAERAERQRLADLLLVVAIGGQGESDAITVMERMRIAEAALFGGRALATGGYVTGPGTSTSDSIPARLSAGEYVLQAAAVRTVGVSFLDALNGIARGPRVTAGRLAFAEGGLVESLKPSGPTGAAQPSVRIVNVVDPSLAHDYLNSSAGERTILNVLARNARAVRQVLA
jgi:hypothetical protein